MSHAAAPLRAAKGKHAQKSGAENASESAAAADGGVRPVQSAASKEPAVNAASSEQPAGDSKSAISSTIKGATIKPGATNGSSAGAGANNSSGAASNSPAGARNALPGAENGKSKSLEATATNAKPELVRPASTPQPTRDGQSTLTRTLGLKIGRIVIDPCHG